MRIRSPGTGNNSTISHGKMKIVSAILRSDMAGLNFSLQTLILFCQAEIFRKFEVVATASKI
jgi:hypothetical protein